MSVNSNQIQITQTVETSFEDINPHVETRDSQCNMTQNRKCFLTKILEGYQQRNAIDPLKTETSTEPYFHKSEELKKCEPRIRPKYVPLYSGPSLLEKLAGITRKNMAIGKF